MSTTPDCLADASHDGQSVLALDGAYRMHGRYHLAASVLDEAIGIRQTLESAEDSHLGEASMILPYVRHRRQCNVHSVGSVVFSSQRRSGEGRKKAGIEARRGEAKERGGTVWRGKGEKVENFNYETFREILYDAQLRAPCLLYPGVHVSGCLNNASENEVAEIFRSAIMKLERESLVFALAKLNTN
eukprot:1512201-Rhodomonas_salina.1